MFTRLGLVLPAIAGFALNSFSKRRGMKRAQTHSDWCEKEVGPAPKSKDIAKTLKPGEDPDVAYFNAMSDWRARVDRASKAKALAITATNKSFRADSRLDFVRTLGNRTFWSIWPAVEGGCIVGLLMWMSVNAPDTLAAWFNVAHQALTVGGTMFSAVGDWAPQTKDGAAVLGGLMGVAGLCWGVAKLAKPKGKAPVSTITHDANQERLLQEAATQNALKVAQDILRDQRQTASNKRILKDIENLNRLWSSYSPFTANKKIG